MWKVFRGEIYNEIDLPDGCRHENGKVTYRPQFQFEPILEYRRRKSFFLGLVQKRALARRKERIQQCLPVPPGDQLRFRSGPKRAMKKHKWNGVMKEVRVRGEWERKRAETERKMWETKQSRQRKEVEPRKRWRKPENDDLAWVARVRQEERENEEREEQVRAQRLEGRAEQEEERLRDEGETVDGESVSVQGGRERDEGETDEERTQRLRWEERVGQEEESMQMEGERHEGETEDEETVSLQGDEDEGREAYEIRQDERRPIDDDCISLMGNVSFPSCTVEASNGWQNRSSFKRNREEEEYQIRRSKYLRDKEILEKQEAEVRERKLLETEERKQNEEFRQEYQTDQAKKWPNTFVPPEIREEKVDETVFQTVPESEVNWDKDMHTCDVLSGVPQSGEHKYSHLGRKGRKRARAEEHREIARKVVEQGGGSEQGAELKRARKPEFLAEKKTFLLDVITNTFDFGGGHARIDPSTKKRYKYRTIEQIGGRGCEVSLLKFCKDNPRFFKVTGMQYELVQPGRVPKFIEVPTMYYTIVSEMRKVVEQLERTESSYGFDAEFFGYNLYKPHFVERFTKRVKEDNELQLGRDANEREAELYVQNIRDRTVKQNKFNKNGELRLAVEKGIRIIQIYSEKQHMAYVFLLRRNQEQWTLKNSGLARFIENEKIRKFVVGHGDMEHLNQRHFLKCCGFVDLQDLATDVTRDVITLEGRAKMCISSNVMAISCGLDQPEFKSCKELCVDPECKTLGWMFDELDEEATPSERRRDLLQYAAYDAYAAQLVGNFLLRLLGR